MYSIKCTSTEFNALIAGLRLLAVAMDKGEVTPEDGDIGSILSSDGDALDADGISEFCDELLEPRFRA
ncbi:hypothetical protein [Luteibacter sp. 22Crub2.1]|uniref:hypothetical protein n=1 Tax=Luteibacter sp. 22Crub2.1 TaxID=1283288 RepID=UPI0009A776CB|nr:hypothetical protein [Luteibacter sp. 22Crub2.1]SKB50955.1 hypothetical protein SAMN05660880_01388 [Luteibacter sp. 22Crub2.1]